MGVSVVVGAGIATVAVAVGGLGVLDGGTAVGIGVLDGGIGVRVGVIGVSVGGTVNVGGWKGVSDGTSVSVADGVMLGPGVAESRLGVGDGPMVGIIRVSVAGAVSVTVGVGVRAPGGGTSSATKPRQ